MQIQLVYISLFTLKEIESLENSESDLASVWERERGREKDREHTIILKQIIDKHRGISDL